MEIKVFKLLVKIFNYMTNKTKILIYSAQIIKI